MNDVPDPKSAEFRRLKAQWDAKLRKDGVVMRRETVNPPSRGARKRRR